MIKRCGEKLGALRRGRKRRLCLQRWGYGQHRTVQGCGFPFQTCGYHWRFELHACLPLIKIKLIENLLKG